MESQLKDIYEKLSEKDYKLTPQRQVILRAFLDNTEKHLSADDVYNIIRKTHPEVGLATVYRTLDLLAELSILQKMDFGDGRSRYEFAEEEIHHHHHLICVSCGRVIEFEDDLMESLEAMISRKCGFKILDHEVKFYGRCDECQKRA